MPHESVKPRKTPYNTRELPQTTQWSMVLAKEAAIPIVVLLSEEGPADFDTLIRRFTEEEMPIDDLKASAEALYGVGLIMLQEDNYHITLTENGHEVLTKLLENHASLINPIKTI